MSPIYPNTVAAAAAAAAAGFQQRYQQHQQQYQQQQQAQQPPQYHNTDISHAIAQGQGQPPDDWTFEYIRTLVTWLNYSNVNLFLIDMSIRYFKMILSHVMAYTLLFSTISSTISISQLGISKDTSPALYNGIQYTFIAASTLSTLLIGYVKLFKVQESLDANTVLYKNWLSFSTRISSEFQMPVHMRTSALTLLQDMKNEYIDLFCRNASIPFAVQRSANRYFQRNLGATPAIYGCWSRPNYIKRTNIFFIFHDIIKNEIKRLSAELTPITDYGAEDDEYENVVPSYYQGGPATPKTPKYIGPQAIIEYKYDGPFIVIEVRDRNDSAAFMRHKTRQAAAARRRQLRELSDDARRKVTPMSRLMAAAAAAAPGPAADDSGDESRRGGGFLELLHVPMRRERQMSFSLPERSLMQRGPRSSGDLMSQMRSQDQDQGSRPMPSSVAPAADGESSLTAESVSSASSTVSVEDVAIQVVPAPAREPVEADTDSF